MRFLYLLVSLGAVALASPIEIRQASISSSMLLIIDNHMSV